MLLTKVEELLGFKDGLFSDLFWTAGLSGFADFCIFLVCRSNL